MFPEILSWMKFVVKESLFQSCTIDDFRLCVIRVLMKKRNEEEELTSDHVFKYARHAIVWAFHEA